jgi:hypothetical protein
MVADIAGNIAAAMVAARVAAMGPDVSGNMVPSHCTAQSPLMRTQSGLQNVADSYAMVDRLNLPQSVARSRVAPCSGHKTAI